MYGATSAVIYTIRFKTSTAVGSPVLNLPHVYVAGGFHPPLGGVVSQTPPNANINGTLVTFVANSIVWLLLYSPIQLTLLTTCFLQAVKKLTGTSRVALPFK